MPRMLSRNMSIKGSSSTQSLWARRSSMNAGSCSADNMYHKVMSGNARSSSAHAISRYSSGSSSSGLLHRFVYRSKEKNGSCRTNSSSSNRKDLLHPACDAPSTPPPMAPSSDNSSSSEENENMMGSTAGEWNEVKQVHNTRKIERIGESSSPAQTSAAADWGQFVEVNDSDANDYSALVLKRRGRFYVSPNRNAVARAAAARKTQINTMW